MKISKFKVESWMNEFENDAVYNLGETCVDSLTIDELLELSGEDSKEFLTGLGKIRMTYGHIYGSPELKAGIANLYEDIDPENVIPTHGAIGANYQVLMSLVEPSDNVVPVMPTYQQHYSIPESIGAEVRPIKLRKENGFVPDIDELKSLVDKNTKLITINNPNNPTGALISPKMLKEIVGVAKSVNAYLLSDEVYRGISEDGSYMPSVVDFYDKGISVGSMSKVMSLAGLRMGWIVTNNDEVREACLRRRDYDTISCGQLDDLFSALALKHVDKIFDRNRKIMNENRKILDDWVNENDGVSYVKPVSGTTALVFYDRDMPSYDLCVKLIREKGVLFTPGSCFEEEGSVRIGYAFDSGVLKEGLDKFTELLGEI